MVHGAAIPVYTRDMCIEKLRNYYEKYHRVPSDKDFRFYAQKYDLPSHHTLKKHCPETIDQIFSEACGVESCSDLLQSFIESAGKKRTLYVRANDLSKLSTWAKAPIISKWLGINTGEIIAGYRLSLFSSSRSGNGYLYQLTAVRPWGAEA